MLSVLRLKKMHKLRMLCAGISLVLIICLHQLHYYRKLTLKLEQELNSLGASSHRWQPLMQCKFPKLDPYNLDVIPFYMDKPRVDCGQIFNKKSGLAYTILSGNYLHQLRDVGCPCCIQPFSRDGDESVRLSGKCINITKPVTEIPPHIKYIEIQCQDGNIFRYRDVFAIVHPKTPRKYVPPTAPDKKRRLNVVILLLDSTSQQNFHRKMPHSRRYLVDSLSAINLKFYNKVGFNTLPNAAALLTGQTITKLINSCVRRRKNDSSLSQLDECPFIWKEFSSRGYLTTFMEDCTVWSVLNYYWNNAFSSPPTDYYYRPVSLHMDSFLPNIKQEEMEAYMHCHGPRFTFDSMLNFGEMIAEMALRTDQSFFQLIWSSRQSHGGMNDIGFLDDHLAEVLTNFESMKAFNSTALFILGDHGFHYHGNYYAQTPHGEMEDKRPVAYVVLPKWFQQQFPSAFHNLEKNSEKRITPYDIHATMFDLMDLDQLHSKNLDVVQSNRNNKHAFSIFQSIPEHRTCLDAQIPLQYCILCFPKINMSKEDPLVVDAAAFIVSKINDRTLSYRNVCQHFTLKSVDNAWSWDPRDVFFAIYNRHQSTQELNISTINSSIEVVEMALTTHPNDGIYMGEAMRLQNGEWKLTDNALRIDWYTDESKCVQDKEVKPFCFCTAGNQEEKTLKTPL